MKPPGDEEYPRFLGFPSYLWPKWLQSYRETVQSGGNSAWMRYPVTWFRWRIVVRRQGPYAPDFTEFRRAGGSSDPPPDPL